MPKTHSTRRGGSERRTLDGESSRDLSRPLPRGLSWGTLIAFSVGLAITVATGILPLWIAGLYGVLSLVAFAAHGLDKRAARRGAPRVSEDTLLTIGIIGGWPGALVAQQVFRHKTRKRAFRRTFWATVFLNVAALVALVVIARHLGWDLAAPWEALLSAISAG